jgi:hypothetical protein
MQSLAATLVSRRVDVRLPVVKMIAESLSQHDEIHVVATPLSIRKGQEEDMHTYHSGLIPKGIPSRGITDIPSRRPRYKYVLAMRNTT